MACNYCSITAQASSFLFLFRSHTFLVVLRFIVSRSMKSQSIWLTVFELGPAFEYLRIG